MREWRPSATARSVATRRAAHQLLDDPKVFEDPVSIRIIGEEAAAALKADPGQSQRSPLSSYLRAFVAARSRFAEDELALAIRRGVRQYVIMGAGLDTFPYRNPYAQGLLHVFEVDHPATQAWKRKCLKDARITVPADLAFVPVDFDRQAIEEELRKAGYDPGVGAFFSWLGVTEYLTNETVTSTLRFVAAAAAGSAILFDYIVSPLLLTPAQKSRFDELARRVASAGEPWRSFFDPQLLIADLVAMGFVDVEDNGPEKINERYFKNRADGLRVGSFSHIVVARV